MKETQWIVIAGAPSSGKTTVAHQLFQEGWRIVPEVPRALIEFDMAIGKTIEEIRGNGQLFQCRVVEYEILRERSLSPDDHLVLDIALPDLIPYCRMQGVSLKPIEEECRKRRYAHVFLLDPLPFVRDHVRTEDSGLVAKIDQEIEQSYREHGYSPIRVPILSSDERESVQRRTSFILEAISCRPLLV